MPTGGREDYFGVRASRFDAFDGRENRFAAQKHAVAAAIRRIVDGFMRAEPKITQINVVDCDNSPVLRLIEHRAVEIGLERLWEKCDDGELDFWHS